MLPGEIGRDHQGREIDDKGQDGTEYQCLKLQLQAAEIRDFVDEQDTDGHYG